MEKDLRLYISNRVAFAGEKLKHTKRCEVRQYYAGYEDAFLETITVMDEFAAALYQNELNSMVLEHGETSQYKAIASIGKEDA